MTSTEAVDAETRSALERLQRLRAAGALSKEEFERRREALAEKEDGR